MHTIEITERNIFQHIPEHWDEMKPEVLKYVLSQSYLFTTDRISYDTFILRTFFKIANVKRNWRTLVWEKLVPAFMLEQKNANVSQLAEKLTKFMFKVKDKKKEFNYDTVRNHLPVLVAKKVKYYGPAHILSDLTFGEFRAAMEEMNEYFREKDEHSLNRMIACLYRPQPAGHEADQHEGRQREPFNRSRVEHHAAGLQKLQPWERLAVLLWFTWCIHYIQSEDLEIEGRKINLSPLFPKKEENSGDIQQPSLGWTGVLFGVAKEGVFGDIQHTDKASLFDVLLFMYDNHLQNERAKSKSK